MHDIVATSVYCKNLILSKINTQYTHCNGQHQYFDKQVRCNVYCRKV